MASSIRLAPSARPRAVRVSQPRQRFASVVPSAKKSVGDLGEKDLKGKVVFERADLNVPLDKQFNITDDTRIRAAIPTIEYLVSKGAKVLLSSHLASTTFVTFFHPRSIAQSKQATLLEVVFSRLAYCTTGYFNFR